MKLRLIIAIILSLFILYFLFYSLEDDELLGPNRTLENDGFITMNAPKSADVLARLPEGYQFLDYTYSIKNASLSTFHRDVTSSKTIYETKYPVYTLIVYLYDGKLLSVCPGSDKTNPFTNSRILNVWGPKGTAFLFDCDLLHAGCLNRCKKRELVQYKICHKDDVHKLRHLNGINMTKEYVCKMSVWNHVIRKASYFFEMPINYFLYPFLSKRYDNDSTIGKIQSIIPIQFYNNDIKTK
jgi:hypothetical protein